MSKLISSTLTNIHFISGLPRSGSTLLSGILQQNPLIHASMSSPVAGLINGCLEQMGGGTEFYTFYNEKKEKVFAGLYLMRITKIYPKK